MTMIMMMLLFLFDDCNKEQFPTYIFIIALALPIYEKVLRKNLSKIV